MSEALLEDWFDILSIMGDAELRAELEALVRKRYEPVFAAQREREEKLAALTDEEWWEQIKQAADASDPRLKALAEVDKEDMIEHRFDQQHVWSGGGQRRLIDAEVEKVMPTLIQVRLERNESGPLTEEQYHAASIRTSLDQIKQMSGALNDAVGRQTDPHKRDFLARFAAIVEQDMEEMQVLGDGDVTQEQLDEMTSKFIERMNQLTESIRPPTD